jgi:hypothetical protein
MVLDVGDKRAGLLVERACALDFRARKRLMWRDKKNAHVRLCLFVANSKRGCVSG